MSDAVDRLAQALRDLINEAVELAIARQEAPRRMTSMTPRSQAHLRNMNIKGTTRYMPKPGERPEDPVDEEIRRDYEERFGEPAPKVWGERRLISVSEARAWLGGISPSTFYALVKKGELSLIKIGRRSFVQADELDDLIRRKRDDSLAVRKPNS
ncbi:helix-turn-helix domain-containing protein [Mycobacterium sp. HNNTM2301]|uniref:helix-turn-helix domain-containing protein n=1 Tax=Mycobacterium hainanense TaxID=3289775 RepID=UPI0035A7170B